MHQMCVQQVLVPKTFFKRVLNITTGLTNCVTLRSFLNLPGSIPSHLKWGSLFYSCLIILSQSIFVQTGVALRMREALK